MKALLNLRSVAQIRSQFSILNGDNYTIQLHIYLQYYNKRLDLIVLKTHKNLNCHS